MRSSYFYLFFYRIWNKWSIIYDWLWNLFRLLRFLWFACFSFRGVFFQKNFPIIFFNSFLWLLSNFSVFFDLSISFFFHWFLQILKFISIPPFPFYFSHWFQLSLDCDLLSLLSTSLLALCVFCQVVFKIHFEFLDRMLRLIRILFFVWEFLSGCWYFHLSQLLCLFYRFSCFCLVLLRFHLIRILWGVCRPKRDFLLNKDSFSLIKSSFEMIPFVR